MRKTLLSVTAAVALATALVMPLNARTPAQKGENHPEMRAAMRHLEAAKAALEKAKPEYHGHRNAAIEHTNQALEECQKALEGEGKKK